MVNLQKSKRELHFQCPLTPRAAQIQQESKTARTMALVLGLHVVSLIPYLVVVTLRYLQEGRDEDGALSDAKKVLSIRILAIIGVRFA